MKSILVIVFIICAGILFSQNQKHSIDEKKWALLHPFAAIKVKRISKECYFFYNQADIKSKLDSFSNGGKLDAFRHVFFMAAFAQKITIKKIKKLGVAHEKYNYKQFLKSSLEENETPDSLSMVMDLRNNLLGFEIGSQHKQMPLQELEQLVISEIKKGNAVIMKRNALGQYLDCGGGVIQLKVFLHKWFIPKCLSPSN
jgi:hypothetical protein